MSWLDAPNVKESLDELLDWYEHRYPLQLGIGHKVSPEVLRRNKEVIKDAISSYRAWRALQTKKTVQ